MLSCCQDMQTCTAGVITLFEWLHAWWQLTFELDFKLTVYQLIALQHLSKPTPFVLGLASLGWGAERQVIVIIRFLWIIVGAHFIHPQPDGLSVFILHARTKQVIVA